MLDWLIKLVNELGLWAYAILFGAALLESAAFTGLVVPGESLVLFGGFMAGQGALDLWVLMPCVAVGAIVGDTLGFELGRRLGRRWLLKYGHWAGLREHHLDRTQQFFEDHGGKTVFIGRFIGFLRALAPFVAGSSGMRYGRFLLYNALGGILWSVAFVLLGYLFGQSWRLVERYVGGAGAVVGALIVLVLVLAWLWRMAVRHEATLKRWWSQVADWPPIESLRRKAAPAIAFLEARLSPTGYLGLRLTVGVLVIIGAGWLFGAIAEDVLTQDPLTVVDVQVEQWLNAHKTPGLTQVMLGVTAAGSLLFAGGGTLLLGIGLAIYRRWRDVVALALTVPGGLLLDLLLKAIFQRHRPILEGPVLTLSSFSFPSGHATVVILLYGFVTVLAVGRLIESWRYRVLAVLGLALLVILVDFSRLYLGVHFLSDVLAGNLVGIAWLTICLTGMYTWRQVNRERHTEAASSDAGAG